MSYDASVVSYSNHSDIYADFKLIKITDNPSTVTIDGFFYPTASGDVPILTLHFIGVAQGEADIGISASDLRGMDGDSQIFYKRDIDYVVEVEGDIYVDASAPTIDSVLIESYDAGRVNPILQGYINSVNCNPTDGAVAIPGSVTDKLGNGPTTKNGEITSDNTSPVIQDITAIKYQDSNGINLDKLDTAYVKTGDTVKITATVYDSIANHNVVSGIPAENPSNHIEADITVLNDGIGIAPADYSNPPTAQWIVVLANSQAGQPFITITASDLVGNQSSVHETPINISVDNIVPKSVTKFRTTPGKIVQLTWKFRDKYGSDYWGIRICRKSSVHFHGGAPASLGYPRYDDSIPGTYPVYGKGSNGAAYYAGEVANHDSYYPADVNDEVLVDQQGDTETYEDTSVVQDIYYYQSYTYDKAGNFSTANASHQDRDCITGYFLGDFDNNGQVNEHDSLPLQMALGKDYTFEHWTDFVYEGVRYMDCDIGPTAGTPSRGDGNRFGLPKTDGKCDFEDLMIFSMNYGLKMKAAPFFEPTVFSEDPVFVRTGLPLIYLCLPCAHQCGNEAQILDGRGQRKRHLESQQKAIAEGEVFPVALNLNPEFHAKGAHLMLTYDTRYFEVVRVTEGNHGITLFQVEAKGNLIDINVAALGTGVPLSDETIATVEFKAKGSAPNAIMYLSRVDVRGLRNEKPDDKLANFGIFGLNLSVGKPAVTKIFHNYPNPFNLETWIPFQLSEATDVLIKIYDLKGQLVKTIKFGNTPAGYYLSKEKAVHWNGRSSFGEKVSSGIYFYQFRAGKVIKTSKMVILK
ncbi:T9SS type A sorting domain-containing protein [Candidatus Poribacteria bacterium]|nr:T9SS type A sorting domain-containing protein [Candidatus Poribacteria bacterium]